MISDNENGQLVIGEGGWRGRIENASAGSDRSLVIFRPEDGGPALTLPASIFQKREDGALYLPLVRSAVAAHSLEASSSTASVPGAATAAVGFGEERMVIPLIEESIDIQKRLVDTGGGVRVIKTVTEHEETINEPLGREQVEVTRVPVGRVVEAPAAPREEGDTMIIPVYEERLVVQKQLFLTEELHIKRQRVVDHHEQQTVTLRREEVAVERLSRGAGVGADNGGSS